MKIILVNIGVFQEYILNTIKQLLLHNNTDITILTNADFFDKYTPAAEFHQSNNIQLIAVETLDDINYKNSSHLDRGFRDGFWFYTSQRLFYIYSYMKKYDIQHCIHIENDIMIYENMDNVFPEPLDSIYGVFDSPTRVIASVLYFPNSDKLKTIIDNYDFGKNDMENLGMRADIITPLPIFPKLEGLETNRFNQNFKHAIFDGAAIGQYLGGIDPRNTEKPDTRGFVNETCIIKYDVFRFHWKKEESNLYKPYITIENRDIPIINLHIHSKKLHLFLSDDPRETLLIERT